MALALIAFTIPQYENYPNYWMKAYAEGTTTPKTMALDSAGAVTVAKLELNSQGFPVTTGSAKVIPYINGAYDLWLHPTEALADANDTTGAIQIADDITGVTPVTLAAIQYLTTATMSASTRLWTAGEVAETKEWATGKGYEATYDLIAGTGTADGFHIIAHDSQNFSFVQRGKGDIASALSYPAGLAWGNNRWEISQPISVSSLKDIYIDGKGEILYDNGVEAVDSDDTGVVRLFLGILFTSCENITLENFVLQAGTSIAGGNGVMKDAVTQSNHIKFTLGTNIKLRHLTLDYRTNKPDSAFRTEGGAVNDLMRSFPIYIELSNGVHMIDCGVARTNDTSEIIGFRNVGNLTIHRFWTLSGVGEASTHSSLFKVMLCDDVDIGFLDVQTSYNGSMMDVSGNNIRIHDFTVSNIQGGIVDVTREFGPAGGSVDNITITNVKTTGSNMISTAAASGVLETVTGQSYDSTDNLITNLRVINCETGSFIHPTADNESGVDHAIGCVDVVDGFYLEGYEKRIVNPEHLYQRLTNADTTLNYKGTVLGYTFYQDENAQDYACFQDTGGLTEIIDCRFEFSSTVATTNKSLLKFRDLRIINNDVGVTPENTLGKFNVINCTFINCAITIQANMDFKNCHFENCIILDLNYAMFVNFDKDCTANLIDTSSSLVETDTGSAATFIYFESIGDYSWKGSITGEYVKPAGGYGIIASIVSSGQDVDFNGAAFNCESRASTAGSANEDYCISHWDRNNNETDITNVSNLSALMIIVRANVGGASTSARLNVIGCSTNGKLLRDTGGPFTNSTLNMIGNRCTSTNQTGTWTTLKDVPNQIQALGVAYTPSNVSTDRVFNADTVAIAELADVVGTLIADLQAMGTLK